jgi:hypothetical protein
MEDVAFDEDWPVQASVLRDLGRIPIAWGSLEKTLDLVLMKLAGATRAVDPQLLILISHTNFSRRIQQFEALCDYQIQCGHNLEGYKVVSKRLHEAAGKRNLLMHSGLHFDEELQSLVIVHASSRGTIKAKVDPIEPRDIRAACRLIIDAGRELYALVFKNKPPAPYRII